MKTTQTKPTNPNEHKPTLGLSKPAAEAKAAPEAKVSLKAISSEMKLDPRIAREKLRIAVREAEKYPELAKAHKPRSAWEWPTGSPAEKEGTYGLSALIRSAKQRARHPSRPRARSIRD